MISVDAFDDLLKPLQIASKSESKWQDPMAPSDRLNALKVGMSKHDAINFLLSTGCNDVEEANLVLLNLSKLIAEPHAHITYNLLIVAAVCVKLASNALS